MANDFDEKVIPLARGKETPSADFDCNRDGLYGGLPKARDRSAAGPTPPHPAADGTTGRVDVRRRRG